MIDVQAIKDQVTLADALEFLGLEWPRSSAAHPQMRCPFKDHNSTERPSLTLYPEEGRAWCFGCDDGGDVVNLVQLVKGWDFQQALTELADFADVKDTYVAPKTEPNSDALLRQVSVYAHADVVSWVRRVGITAVEDLDSIFLAYDETMRQHRAKEMDTEEATRRLLEWRWKWQKRLA